MKHATLQIILAVLAATPAAAARAAPTPDPMAAFYGNTLTIAVPAGYYYASRFIEPDGTWTETRGGVVTAHGQWRVEGDKVCNWQSDVTNSNHYCYPVSETHRIGDEWVTEDPVTGNDVIQRIEPGRKAPDAN